MGVERVLPPSAELTIDLTGHIWSDAAAPFLGEQRGRLLGDTIRQYLRQRFAGGDERVVLRSSDGPRGTLARVIGRSGIGVSWGGPVALPSLVTITTTTSLLAPLEGLDTVVVPGGDNAPGTPVRTGVWWADMICEGALRQARDGVRDPRTLPSDTASQLFIDLISSEVARMVGADGTARLTWNAVPCEALRKACEASGILGPTMLPLPLRWRLSDTSHDELRVLMPTIQERVFWVWNGADRRADLASPVRAWKEVVWPPGTHHSAGHHQLDPAEEAVIDRIAALDLRTVARLAGILDVQGTMYIDHNGVVTIRLDSVDRDLVEHVATTVGGIHATRRAGQDAGDSPGYLFHLEGRAAVALCATLAPFLIVRPNRAGFLASLPGRVWPPDPARVAEIQERLRRVVEPSGEVGAWPGGNDGHSPPAQTDRRHRRNLDRFYIAGYLSARGGFSIFTRHRGRSTSFGLLVQLATGGQRLLGWIRAHTGVRAKIGPRGGVAAVLALYPDDVGTLLARHRHLLVGNHSRADIAWRFVTGSAADRAGLKGEMDLANAAYSGRRHGRAGPAEERSL